MCFLIGDQSHHFFDRLSGLVTLRLSLMFCKESEEGSLLASLSPSINPHGISQKWRIKRRNWPITLKVWARNEKWFTAGSEIERHPNGDSGRREHERAAILGETAHVQPKTLGERKPDITEEAREDKEDKNVPDWRWPKTHLNAVLEYMLRLENPKNKRIN